MKNKPRQKRKAGLWGTHAVCAAWLNPARTVKALYTTPQALQSCEETFRTAKNLGLERPNPTIMEKKELDRLLPDHAVHQGLALETEDPEEVFVQDMIIKTAHKDHAVLVMLDQVTDPQNVGAILRSCCAFGADGMILQRRHAPDLTGVLAKAACGAVEHVPVAYETNLSRSLETLQDNGFFVYGLDEDGEEMAPPTIPSKIVLVLGAEGTGLRRLVGEHCDTLVRLPVSGEISSLNVSNAAAVALYAYSTAVLR